MRDEGMGPIPASLVADVAPGDVDVAEEVARRLLTAVRNQPQKLDIVRISGDGDVRSFRIEIDGSPYHATITENAVIERYSVDRLRSPRRRLEARPVLVELMHVFTVSDEEGALVSASDSVPPSNTDYVGSVFGQLFDAARGATTEAALAAARAH